MKKVSFSRTFLVGSIFTLVGLAIIVQFVRILTSSGAQRLSEEATRVYDYTRETIYPERGYIYDRWGHLLASNKEVFEVGVSLLNVRNPETIASVLEEVLDLDYGDVLELCSRDYEQGVSEYVVLANFVSPEDIYRIEEIRDSYLTSAAASDDNKPIPSLAGLSWQPHLQRTYPEDSVASNIIGFYSFRDQLKGKPYFGVEEKYDDLLAGSTIEVIVPTDPNKIEELPTAPPGASLVLTIDREIQTMVEKTIDNAVEQNGAESGTVIIMDPETGEVLAMATTPRLNLNEYWQLSEKFEETTPYNRAVGATFEPGSVFKVLTMAAAIDAGKVTPNTSFLDTGVITIGGINIYNWDRSAWGPQTMLGCMQHSLNVCLTWVATQLGTQDFYHYLDSFGIGQRSNIDLAGEVTWPLSVPGDENWWEANLGTNSFGQGVSVTPIQFVTAISAIANDGAMMAPHVLKSVIENDRQYDFTPQVIGNPIKKETARTMTEMLAISLEEEASVALVQNYRVAGKTGTAEIAGEYGYTSNETNASFVGWGPIDDPKFVVFVWLEKPSSSPWGSVVAAPVFSQIVGELVTYLDIPPMNNQLVMDNGQGSNP